MEITKKDIGREVELYNGIKGTISAVLEDAPGLCPVFVNNVGWYSSDGICCDINSRATYNPKFNIKKFVEETVPEAVQFTYNNVQVNISKGTDSFIALEDQSGELYFKSLEDLIMFKETLNELLDKGQKILEGK